MLFAAIRFELGCHKPYARRTAQLLGSLEIEPSRPKFNPSIGHTIVRIAGNCRTYSAEWGCPTFPTSSQLERRVRVSSVTYYVFVCHEFDSERHLNSNLLLFSNCGMHSIYCDITFGWCHSSIKRKRFVGYDVRICYGFFVSIFLELLKFWNRDLLLIV